jgi:hypothetical protein
MSFLLSAWSKKEEERLKLLEILTLVSVKWNVKSSKSTHVELARM